MNSVSLRTSLKAGVIITGRDEQCLQNVAVQLSNVTAIKSNVSSVADVKALVKQLQSDFPALNVVINNAGRADEAMLAMNPA